MPNWCTNSMTVTGDKEAIDQFIAQMRTQNPASESEALSLDFNSVIPMPHVLKDRVSPSFDHSYTWYEWQTEHWGVKWGANDANVTRIHGKAVSYHFSTPWGPALPWQATVIRYYPWLEFEFSWAEYGMGFRGVMTGKDGAITNHEEHEITDEEYAAEFGEDA